MYGSTNQVNYYIEASTDRTDSWHGEQASGRESCPLCGRQHYCFLIKNPTGEIASVLCQWTDMQAPPDGWAYTGTAKDGRPIFANLSCSGGKRRKSKKYPTVIKLTPEEKTLTQWQDYLIPVEQLEKGHAVRVSESSPGSDEIYVVDSILSNKKGGLTVRLKRKDSSLGGILEVPLKDIVEVVTSDADGKEIFTQYFYSPTQKVIRRQYTDRRKVYNGQSKEIRPYHLVGCQWSDDLPVGGEWVAGKGDEPWRLYREDEAIAQIERGGIVFAVAGEQAVEALRGLGLTATCNQGGEAQFSQIAKALSGAFEVARERGEKPVLVIWGDNDETGRKAAEQLHKECYASKITAVVLDPFKVWADMPKKGDAHNWGEFCRKAGISNEEMLRQLEIAIDAGIDSEEQDAQWRWQRQAWNAPVSHKGEIGFWKEDKLGNRYFEPAANFDFQVEMELQDSDGGGLVLQVKRAFENQQIRVILDSISCTKVDDFINALKRGLGTSIVCNLNKMQLNALIHTRLHEYRTTRNGRLFKRIDRYGQQEDGTWVFRDRQYKKDGTPTNENESGWVFNPSLGKDDFIPCPELAPENPQALQQLMDASRKFFGEQNIYQLLLTMGWTVAGLNSQEIYRSEGCFPLFNAYGETGSCKTVASETALSLIGKNWGQVGMLSKVSVSALYEHGARTGSLPFFWDDPDRNPESEELLKSWYNQKPRKVRGNEQTPHSPLGSASNHILGGEQAATFTRIVRVGYERAAAGNKAAYQELKKAQSLASGAFPQIVALGYPREAIASLEAELLQYLPHAHARIAQNLAIATWYAQKLVEMTGGTENVKQWVIDNCCQSENDADSAGDSLLDFIEKVLSLESESAVGDWNFKRGVERDGVSYYAVYGHDVWKLVDRQFKPATYNEKSLKSLIVKALGITNTTVRFSADKDQVLAYKRAQVTAGRDQNNEPIALTPPKVVPRKAWLIPAHLFGDSDPATEDVTDVTECNPIPVTPPNPYISSNPTHQESECNHVTKKNELEEESTTSSINAEEERIDPSIEPSSGYTSYAPQEEQETTQNQGFESVTETVTNPVTPGYTSYAPQEEQVTAQNQVSQSAEPALPQFDACVNAEIIRDTLRSQFGDIGAMLADLLSVWTEEQKSAVEQYLSQDEIELAQELVRSFLQNQAQETTATPVTNPVTSSNSSNSSNSPATASNSQPKIEAGTQNQASQPTASTVTNPVTSSNSKPQYQIGARVEFWYESGWLTGRVTDCCYQGTVVIWVEVAFRHYGKQKSYKVYNPNWIRSKNEKSTQRSS